MSVESSFVSATDSLTISTYRWDPPTGTPRGVVQIAHGGAEYGLRYARLALALADAGFIVYANDHRGHGRSYNENVPLGYFGTGGWNGLVADAVAFSRLIRAAHPELPLTYLGHSMGSVAGQYLVVDNSELYDGFILCGSFALDSGVIGDKFDESGRLEGFNEGFEHRTGFEWLSRDEAEVDLYAASPLCGFPMFDLMQTHAGASRLADPAVLGGIRHDLPLLVIAGLDDPVNRKGALVTLLADRYQDAGVADVTLKLYEGARHELFNETNRDEVTAYVIDWIDQHVLAKAPISA